MVEFVNFCSKIGKLNLYIWQNIGDINENYYLPQCFIIYCKESSLHCKNVSVKLGQSQWVLSILTSFSTPTTKSKEDICTENQNYFPFYLKISSNQKDEKSSCYLVRNLKSSLIIIIYGFLNFTPYWRGFLKIFAQFCDFCPSDLHLGLIEQKLFQN